MDEDGGGGAGVAGGEVGAEGGEEGVFVFDLGNTERLETGGDGRGKRGVYDHVRFHLGRHDRVSTYAIASAQVRFSIREHLAVELAFLLRRLDGVATGVGLAYDGIGAWGVAFHVPGQTLLIDVIGGRRDVADGGIGVEEGEGRFSGGDDALVALADGKGLSGWAGELVGGGGEGSVG